MAGVSVYLSILMCAYVCDAYHYLLYFPYHGKSQSILGDGHVRNLLEGGHEVTYITSFPVKINNPKLHIINVFSEHLNNTMADDVLNLKTILKNRGGMVIDFWKYQKTLFNMNKYTFHNDNVQKMLKDDKIKFDAVIIQWIMSEFGAAYAAYYDVPYIFFTTTEPHGPVFSLIDELPNPSYTPSLLSSHVPPLNFVQRVRELFIGFFQPLFFDFLIAKPEEAFYEEFMAPLIAKQKRTPPSFKDLRYNTSLILGNSHVSLGSAIRLPQNYKPIGGFHIDTKPLPLPEDLKAILDSAKHGVIYFSMGTYLKSRDLPADLKADLFNLFESLQQIIIWKFEEIPPNLPKNVHVLKWAPQQSILAHPNTILFITHGGLLSSTESIHFGVPTIVIPVFGDQFINADRSSAKGFTLKVDLSYNLANDLKDAIKEMLENSKYSQRAKELSMVYHDRPVTPGRELVHWAEHVVKTRGAPHLRSPALTTSWYQKMYLDFLVVVYSVLVLLKKLLVKCLHSKKLFYSKKNKTK